jgi:hypothetical protein
LARQSILAFHILPRLFPASSHGTLVADVDLMALLLYVIAIAMLLN